MIFNIFKNRNFTYKDYHYLSRHGKLLYKFIKRNFDKEEAIFNSHKRTYADNKMLALKYEKYEIICFDDHLSIYFEGRQIAHFCSNINIEIIYKLMHYLYYHEEVVDPPANKQLYKQMGKI